MKNAETLYISIPIQRDLLTRALKWIRRIEERADDLPPGFLDNCDPKPLRRDIEDALARYNRTAA